MKKFGILSIATGLLSSSAQTCWFKTQDSQIENLETNDSIITVPCECGPGHFDFSYPVLPDGWQVRDNHFYVPAGRFQEN